MNKDEAFKKIDSMESELKALRAIVDAPDAPKARQFTPELGGEYWTIRNDEIVPRNSDAMGGAAFKRRQAYGIAFKFEVDAHKHMAETKKRVQILDRIFELNEGWVRTSQDIGYYPTVRYSSDVGTYQIHEFEFMTTEVSHMSSISPNKYLKTKYLLLKLASEFKASELALVYM